MPLKNLLQLNFILYNIQFKINESCWSILLLLSLLFTIYIHIYDKYKKFGLQLDINDWSFSHYIIISIRYAFQKKKLLLGTYVRTYIQTNILIFRTTFTCPSILFPSTVPKLKSRMLPSWMFPTIISFYFLSFCFFFKPYIPFTTSYVSICFLQFLESRASKWHVWHDLRNLHRFHIIFDDVAS